MVCKPQNIIEYSISSQHIHSMSQLKGQTQKTPPIIPNPSLSCQLPSNFADILNQQPKPIAISCQTYSSFAKSKRGKNDETKQLSNILKRKLSKYFDSISKELTRFERSRVEILKKDKACLKAFRTFFGVGLKLNNEEEENGIMRIRNLSREFFSSNTFMREVLTSPYLKNRKAVLKYLPIIQQAPLCPEKFTSWKKFDDDSNAGLADSLKDPEVSNSQSAQQEMSG